jgi:hypothetical protein
MAMLLTLPMSVEESRRCRGGGGGTPESDGADRCAYATGTRIEEIPTADTGCVAASNAVDGGGGGGGGERRLDGGGGGGGTTHGRVGVCIGALVCASPRARVTTGATTASVGTLVGAFVPAIDCTMSHWMLAAAVAAALGEERALE